MKISKKSIISLNNDTKNKIYLNVKNLKNLISLFSVRINEIFTIIKFIIAQYIFFENFVEKKNTKKQQNLIAK